MLLLPLTLVLPRGRIVEAGLPHVVATKARLPGITVKAASANANTRSKAGEQGGDRAAIGTDEAHLVAAVVAARARFMTRCCYSCSLGFKCWVSSACSRAATAPRRQSSARIYCCVASNPLSCSHLSCIRGEEPETTECNTKSSHKSAWGTTAPKSCAPRDPLCAYPPWCSRCTFALPTRAVHGMEEFPLIRELDGVFQQDPDM